jgi:putative ABC transport system permease protein
LLKLTGNRIPLASLAVGLQALRVNPLRTLLSTLGIIMGVAALVSVLSLGDGMERYARDQIERTTDLNAITITPSLFRVVEGQRFPRSDVATLNRADTDSLAALIAGNGVVTMMLSGQSLVTTRSDSTPRVGQVIGTLANAATALPAPLTAGRFFTDQETRADARVVVLSAELAQRLAGGRPAAVLIGNSVFFQGQPHEVIGVLGGDGPESLAFMPVGAAESALPPALVGRPVSIVIQAARVEAVTGIRADAEAWLARRFGPAWSDRITVATNQTRVGQAQQGMRLFKLFMGALTGISLLVGGVGIMNVLLASVVERTREIGIRKAVGARQRDILLQFLAESVTISAVGSVLGVLFGVVVAFVATAIMRSVTAASFHAGFSFSTLLIAVGASITVGLTFGLYPGLRAARLSPVDAIHRD